MPRRSKNHRTIYDLPITLDCKHCDGKFSNSREWFSRNDYFICPKCAKPSSFRKDEIPSIHGEQFKRVKDGANAMQSDGSTE
ncbi:protein of unknown function [Azospirillum lipoferum 4B]|uniref:Uncharacterized protein n=1 Tax=Azospirillum lipoferum (strain 4B) TaxID=862719 RepID=G7Z7T0_AZOL4|nr:protein of unknown function [Azospirillum lipoferum 4B]